MTPREKEGSDEADWEPPMSLSQFDLPPFPVRVLPDWLREFVEALATATQTPTDLVGMLCLAVIAASCAKKVVVRIKDGYDEPVNIFTVTTLAPANRKTAVFKEVARPLEEYERSEAQRMRPDIAKQQSARKIKEGELARLQNTAPNASSKDQEKLAIEAAQLAAELAETEIPSPPRFIADDCTPERLATILSDQGGRIAIMSPEGDVFDLMAGRYSSTGTSNLGVYLKGHAGDTLRVDRVKRPSEFVKEPALTIGLAVQPEVIRGLIEKPGFRGRGLLGRFLYAVPTSLLGSRDVNAAPVPNEVRDKYHNNVLALLRFSFGSDLNGHPAPHALILDVAARTRMRQFEAWLEPQLGEFGELGALTTGLANSSAPLAGSRPSCTWRSTWKHRRLGVFPPRRKRLSTP